LFKWCWDISDKDVSISSIRGDQRLWCRTGHQAPKGLETLRQLLLMQADSCQDKNRVRLVCQMIVAGAFVKVKTGEGSAIAVANQWKESSDQKQLVCASRSDKWRETSDDGRRNALRAWRSKSLFHLL